MSVAKKVLKPVTKAIEMEVNAGNAMHDKAVTEADMAVASAVSNMVPGARESDMLQPEAMNVTRNLPDPVKSGLGMSGNKSKEEGYGYGC